MAILRSMDGKFYQVPDGELGNYEVPAEQVKEKLASAGAPLPSGPQGCGPSPGGGGMGGGGGGPASMPPGGLVYVQVFNSGPTGRGSPSSGAMGAPAGGESGGEVQPYAGCWRNWKNCWRNCWRNYCP